MPVERRNSISLRQTERQPFASSPVVNALRASELKSKNLQNLSISDCSCPICLEILIEPVVLPCKHELCLPCFKDMMDQTNFLCPMCRMRLSTWARSASKQNTLVDKERWSQIQRTFASEIRNRMEGKTATILAEEIKNQKEKNSTSSFLPKVSAQGEIKKEYEDYLKREEERIRLEKEKEEALSLKYIQEIIQQEEACTMNDYLRNLIASRPTLAQQPADIQPQPTTSSLLPTTNSTNVQQTSTVTIQPFITPTVPSTTTDIKRTASSRLVNRVKYSLAASSTSGALGSTSQQASSPAVSMNVTPSYSLRPRASIKRSLDEIKSFRSDLINSFKNENNTSQSNVSAVISDETHQPRSKRTQRTSSSSLNGSNLSNESIGSHVNETIDLDSKQPVLPQGMNLIRRKSVRVSRK